MSEQTAQAETINADDVTTIPAARKLIRDAQAAGHRVKVSRPGPQDPFLRVGVTNAALETGILAEWWDGSSVREWNRADLFAVGAPRGGKHERTLKAARAHVGL